jgi:predicted site-specific integrase-resolvase
MLFMLEYQQINKKTDLNNQILSINNYCKSNNIEIEKIYSDIRLY